MRCSLVAIFLVLGSAASAQAAVLLDQEHDNTGSGVASSTNGAVAEPGQTFTVGIAGTLDHIDVLMFRLLGIFDPVADPKLNVYNTAGGIPTGLPVVTVTVPEASVPVSTEGFVTFDVSAAAISVNVGDVLAWSITTNSDPQPYFVMVDGDIGQPEDYAPGKAVNRFPPGPWTDITPPSDHGFRTYVNAVPEPSTFVLAAIVLFGAVCVACRRR